MNFMRCLMSSIILPLHPSIANVISYAKLLCYTSTTTAMKDSSTIECTPYSTVCIILYSMSETYIL